MRNDLLEISELLLRCSSTEPGPSGEWRAREAMDPALNAQLLDEAIPDAQESGDPARVASELGSLRIGDRELRDGPATPIRVGGVTRDGWRYRPAGHGQAIDGVLRRRMRALSRSPLARAGQPRTVARPLAGAARRRANPAAMR